MTHTPNLDAAKAADLADTLAPAAAFFAAAYDLGEAVDARTALEAALVFFDATDGGSVPVEPDPYCYFDLWIARASELGAEPCATFWKNYEAMINRGGVWSEANAQHWLDEGCEDAILTLACNFPDRFRNRAANFAVALRDRRSARERYLYSILGPRFDPEYA